MMNMGADGIAQGLEPACFLGVCGTTEVVPCYKPSLDDFSAGCKAQSFYGFDRHD
jgi:hypothetical protein